MGNTIAVKPVPGYIAIEPAYYFKPGSVSYSQKPCSKINRGKVFPKKIENFLNNK
jgi:hypothetical protein